MTVSVLNDRPHGAVDIFASTRIETLLRFFIAYLIYSINEKFLSETNLK